MAPRNDFLNQLAPENYVAGLGRGATGFTTRSDLGPAKEGPSEDQIKEALAKRAAQAGITSSFGGTDKKKDDDNDQDDDRFQDPDNEVGLFAGGNFDKDDDEADRLYQDVEEKMDKRRRARREAREKQEQAEYEANNPKIQQQFADLKRALGSVTDDEWAAIPEVGDLTGKNKRTRMAGREKFYATPDSVLAGARQQGQFDTSIDAKDGNQTTNGSNGSSSADGTATNFADIGRAKDKVLQVRLDQASSNGASSGTATSVDPKGYLTGLEKSGVSMAELQAGDINRIRPLLENVTKTNPKHAPAWTALALFEETAGKLVAARNIIARGCQMCPHSEDVWLKNIDLNEGTNAKIIAAQAVQLNDTSVRLWEKAIDLEVNPRDKKKVVRKALDFVPTSVQLWKTAVNLEDDPSNAKLLLAKATETIPLSVELWLALARLETPEVAQQVLNAARKAVPTSHEIYIQAARLQEQMGEAGRVDALMKRAVRELAKQAAALKRDDWIAEAEKCEDEGAVATSAAIIKAALGLGLDDETEDDRRTVWMNDAKMCLARGKIATGRAVYDYLIHAFYDKKVVWLAAADCERAHGSKDTLIELLEKSTVACPTSKELWLQLAREVRYHDKEDSAREVLARAFKQNPGNEDIWLAAVNLEYESGDIEKARTLLKTARDEAQTDRIWIKSATFERASGKTEEALHLINDALSLYPKNGKLYMMKGQIYENDFNPPKLQEASETFKLGVRSAPRAISLWILAARNDEKLGALTRARATLDRGRLANPKEARLWLESIRMERRAGDTATAQNLMARAMGDVPKAKTGLLWAERIWHLEPRNQRKALALTAIKEAGEDPILYVSIARIFWAERRLEKAINWFEKAVLLDPDIGDTWAWYVKFLRMHGTEDKIKITVSSCVSQEPKHGEVWPMVAKDPKNVGKRVELILDLVIAQLA